MSEEAGGLNCQSEQKSNVWCISCYWLLTYCHCYYCVEPGSGKHINHINHCTSTDQQQQLQPFSCSSFFHTSQRYRSHTEHSRPQLCVYQFVRCNNRLMDILLVYFVNATSLAKPNAAVTFNRYYS